MMSMLWGFTGFKIERSAGADAAYNQSRSPPKKPDDVRIEQRTIVAE